MINARAKAGHATQAEYWLMSMKRAGLEPDERAYNVVVCAFAKSGLAERAEHWLRDMESQGLKPDQISVLALMLAWAKKGEAAKSAELRMQSLALDGHTINPPQRELCEKRATWVLSDEDIVPDRGLARHVDIATSRPLEDYAPLGHAMPPPSMEMVASNARRLAHARQPQVVVDSIMGRTCERQNVLT
eukprot:UN5013